jgi:hypothetical protein
MAHTNFQVEAALYEAEPEPVEGSQAQHRLRGRPLLLARAVWVMSVLINLVAYVSGIPTSYAIANNLSAPTAARLAELGLAANFPATYLIILDTITLIIFGFVALAIFKRRSDEPNAMVASAMLIFTAMLYTAPGYEARAPIFMVATGAALGEMLQIAFLLMFPDGRFWPRWSWLLLGPILLWRVAVWYFMYLPKLASFDRVGEIYPFALPPDGVDLLLLVLVFAFAIGAQVHRYRHTSSPAQRQQTRWIVWGMSITVLIVGSYTVAIDMLPIFQRTSEDMVMMRLLGRTVRQLALCAIPITLLYSILRYKLWNVDILINRTLVYVPLTSVLAGIFAVTMTITQKIFVSATGEGSEFATVITTLVLTTTITPIKNEIENFVDRLFKEAPDQFRHLTTFDQQVRAVVDVMDVEHLLRRLLNEALGAVDSCGGAVCLVKDGALHLVSISSGWEGLPVLQLPINHHSHQQDANIGWLLLGSRRDGESYSEDERRRLQQSLDEVGHALMLMLAERRTIRTRPLPAHLTAAWPAAGFSSDGGQAAPQADQPEVAQPISA